jgi:branched-chain amino acid aminotransferase
MSKPKYAFFRGQIVPFQEAKISVATHAFNYGTGCFEGIRGFWNKEEKKLFLFGLRSHYQRFLENWKLLYINLDYRLEDLVKITLELLEKERIEQDVYIRPIAYKSSEKIGVRLTDLENDLTIFVLPFGSYYQDEENVRAVISSWQRIEDNAIPARIKAIGSYLNSALIKSEALLAGFDEAIALNRDGHVSEASAANIFIIKDETLITPPVTANILEGVTRKVILKLAKEELALEVQEREIDRTELYLAQEVGVCGTACNISAITSIDNISIGNGQIGPIIKELRKLYFQIARGQITQDNPWYRWLTPLQYP